MTCREGGRGDDLDSMTVNLTFDPTLVRRELKVVCDWNGHFLQCPPGGQTKKHTFKLLDKSTSYDRFPQLNKNFTIYLVFVTLSTTKIEKLCLK